MKKHEIKKAIEELEQIVEKKIYYDLTLRESNEENQVNISEVPETLSESFESYGFNAITLDDGSIFTKQDLTNLMQRSNQLKEKLSSYRQVNKDLNLNIDVIHQQLDRARQQVANRDKLLKDQSALRWNKKVLESDNEKKEELIKTLREEKSLCEGEIKELRTRLYHVQEEYEKEIESHFRKNMELSKENSEMFTRIENDQDKIDSLIDVIQNLKYKLNTSESSLQNQDEKIERLSNQIKGLINQDGPYTTISIKYFDSVLKEFLNILNS